MRHFAAGDALQYLGMMAPDFGDALDPSWRQSPSLGPDPGGRPQQQKLGGKRVGRKIAGGVLLCCFPPAQVSHSIADDCPEFPPQLHRTEELALPVGGRLAMFQPPGVVKCPQSVRCFEVQLLGQVCPAHTTSGVVSGCAQTAICKL